MGRDKGRLRFGGASLVERGLAVLAEVADDVVLLSGSGARYAELGTVELADRGPHEGPLGALLVALEEAQRRGQDTVFVLACDMPFARAEVLRALADEARTSRADAVLLETEDGLQPLYAVYRVTRTLPAVRSALAAGERRMIAFHEGHGPLGVRRVPAASVGDGTCAWNVNTRADWERALERGA